MNHREFRPWLRLVIALALYLGPFTNAVRAQESAPSNGGTPWYQQLEKPFVGGQTPIFDLSEQPWAQGLSITGLYSNSSGMWVNSENLRGIQNLAHSVGIPVSTSKNSLAVERNWFQLDFNYSANANNQFFLRWWGVYEPRYDMEEGAGLRQLYNQYTIRDAWWKHKEGPLTLFLGRQIVTWGESVAFRIGDVVNPQDFEWNFGFANLEQSRMPLYMVHPILSLPDAGPLNSNFAEGIWAPGFQPIYTNSPRDFGGVDMFDGQNNRGGAVSLLPPGTGGRFSTFFGPTIGPGLGPVPCPISDRGCRPDWPQLVNPGAITFDNFKLPPDNLGGSQGGIRLHTVVQNTEVTALFWHGHQYIPTFFLTGRPVGTPQNFQARYPQLNDIGITANRPIYLPGSTLRDLPLVLRTEAVWQDRTPFQSQDLRNLSAVQYSSTINTLVALDLDNYYVPWLSRSGALTMNLEWNNYTILSPSKTMTYTFTPEGWRHNEDNLLLNVTDSWHWGAVVPTLVGIYNPDGSTFLLFPNLLLVPPWTSKYSLMLQYIGILGNDVLSSYAGGGFKGKSIFLMQFQYNFSVAKGG
jgi:hypothetical protein